MPERTLCRIHLTMKPDHREAHDEYFVYLTPGQIQSVELRLRQLFDNNLIVSQPTVTAIELAVIAAEELDGILSRLVYGLPTGATTEGVVQTANPAGAEDWKRRLEEAQRKPKRAS